MPGFGHAQNGHGKPHVHIHAEGHLKLDGPQGHIERDLTPEKARQIAEGIHHRGLPAPHGVTGQQALPKPNGNTRYDRQNRHDANPVLGYRPYSCSPQIAKPQRNHPVRHKANQQGPIQNGLKFGYKSDSASSPTVLEQQIAQAVFQAINTDRASAGLPALVWSTSLVSSAYAHNLVMSAGNELAHQLAGEPAISTRISQSGVKWTWCGENIGETTNISASGALKLHRMMMAEQPPDDGHRQNILSTNFTLGGIAIFIDSSRKLWLTEDFAK